MALNCNLQMCLLKTSTFNVAVNCILCTMCSSRKYLYSPHSRDWNILMGEGGGRGGGVVQDQKMYLRYVQCMKLDWNFQWVGGFLEETPRSMGDIFGNHTCTSLDSVI